jgi:predicted metal-dependent hydrolase
MRSGFGLQSRATGSLLVEPLLYPQRSYLGGVQGIGRGREHIYQDAWRCAILCINIIENYYRLKNGKYRELRNIYPNIPSHYVHGVCQDAVERVSSLRRNRAGQYAEEIFNEIVKYLNLGEKDLKNKKLVGLL